MQYIEDKVRRREMARTVERQMLTMERRWPRRAYRRVNGVFHLISRNVGPRSWFRDQPTAANFKWLLARYVENPHRFGNVFVQHLPGELLTRLNDLSAGRTEEPFLVVRSYYPRNWGYAGRLDDKSYGAMKRQIVGARGDAGYYVSNGYVDVMSSAVLAALGVQHKSKVQKKSYVARDYLTTPAAEIDQFSGDEDIPRRFRQAVPEHALEDDPAGRAGKVTARYVVYACIENPIRDPIWILPARHVIEALDEPTRMELRNSVFEFFDHWEEDLSARTVKIAQKVLGGPKGEKDQWVSFDANRFNWDHTQTTPAGHLAIGRLRAQISRSAATQAIPVVLKRGDALIVDNYRALIRRTEIPHSSWRARLLRRPAIRWLRMYCGFPQVSNGH